MDRLEVYQGSGSAERDLAFEGWMLERAAAGRPCLLLASWEGPVTVLGYAQDPSEVDLEWCRSHGIPVLRRLSGGSGVIHRRDLSVALALPVSHVWARGVLGLYDRFLEVLVVALREAGAAVERKTDAPRATRARSPICFMEQLTDTLLVEGRKAVGCAQTRRRGAALVHAAVLLDLDPELYARVFRSDAELVRGALAPAVRSGDRRALGGLVARLLAEALGLAAAPVAMPTLPASYQEPYRTAKWAPLLAVKGR